jgi:hypothetical protein
METSDASSFWRERSAAQNLLLVAAKGGAVEEGAIFLLDGGGRIPDIGACERMRGACCWNTTERCGPAFVSENCGIIPSS